MKHITFCALIFCLIFGYLGVNGQTFRDSIKVSHYKLELDFRKMGRETISGVATLKVKTLFATSQISLDLEKLQVDSAFEGNIRLQYSLQNNKLTLNLQKRYAAGDSLVLKVYYHGQPRADKSWGGFYFKDAFAYNYGIAMASSPVSAGRFWYPCIDNFTNRATYDFSIHVNSIMTGVANGVLQEILPQADGSKIFRYRMSQPVPSYLTNVGVGRYNELKADFKGLPIRNYVIWGDEKKGKVVVEKIPNFITSLSSAFGPYRWGNVGYLCTPFVSGAMEHATLISYPYWAVDFDAGEYILLHEFAHHWFGNLVTCHSISDVWFNEGGASYCEAVYCEKMYGQKAYKKYMRDVHNEVLNMEINHRALYGVPEESAYEPTVYKRGSLFFYALRNAMDDSAFFQSFRQLFAEKAMTDMKTEEIIQYLGEKSKQNLLPFFEANLYRQGFTELFVSNLTSEKKANSVAVKFKVEQRLFMKEQANRNVKFSALFVSSVGETKTLDFVLDSATQSFTAELPFVPEFIWPDPQEKLMDASVEEIVDIDKPATFTFETCNAKLIVSALKKKSQFFIRRFGLNPDISAPNPEIKGYLESAWQLAFVNRQNLDGKLTISFKDLKFKQIKPSFGGNRPSEFKLMYKKEMNSSWQWIECEIDETDRTVSFPNPKNGFYTLFY
jgi:aminopeptidase N